MIGDYRIIRNPSIHFVGEEIPDFVVSKVVKEFHPSREMTFTFTGEITYVNEDLINKCLERKK